jgi:hypothetical protein
LGGRSQQEHGAATVPTETRECSIAKGAALSVSNQGTGSPAHSSSSSDSFGF